MHDVDKQIINDTLVGWNWGFQAEEVIEQIELLLDWFGNAIVSYRLSRVDNTKLWLIINHSKEYRYHSNNTEPETFNLYVNNDGYSRHEYYLEVKKFEKLSTS